jgi:hypothetical protein
MLNSIMWVINGIERGTGRIRQHGDLSYWVSDQDVVSVIGADVLAEPGPWLVSSDLESLVGSRQRTQSGFQASFDPQIGTLEFQVARMDGWEPICAGNWADDIANNPDDPAVAASAQGRGIVWHLEGFDRARLFMVEHFELSHRISESEILAALGNPPNPYYGGLPPTTDLMNLVNARIELLLSPDELDYQLNTEARYGHQRSLGYNSRK